MRWNSEGKTMKDGRCYWAALRSTHRRKEDDWVGVKQIQVFINEFLRQMLGIRWPEKISNENLWQQIGQGTNHLIIQRTHWSWIGHTLSKECSIARLALDWNGQGGRKQGRPKNTWCRGLQRDLDRVTCPGARLRRGPGTDLADELQWTPSVPAGTKKNKSIQMWTKRRPQTHSHPHAAQKQMLRSWEK